MPAFDDVITKDEWLDEVQTKETRLRQWLGDNNYGAMLISQLRNFSWITGGGDTHIVITSEGTPCYLLLRQDGPKYLIANGSEAPRLMEEQLDGLGYELKFYRWWTDKAEPNRVNEIVKELTQGVRLCSDATFAGADVIPDAQIATELRIPLTDSEITKYRWLGRECAAGVAETCRQVQPGMTEEEMEGITCDNLMKRGIRPTVLLIAADDRIMKYRHAIPAGAALRNYAMINICARRWGLVIATTRFVYFGQMPGDLQQKFEKAAYMDAVYMNSTQPGRSADEILRRAQREYARVGYPDEWMLHHQGGAIGYAERDWVTYPGCTQTVHARQAFAWNPTLQGGKIEDTILCTEQGVEVLTESPGDWPMIEVEVAGKTYKRPGVLVR
jgi:antitoxin VapB